jgi:hypothetical protein
MRLPLLLIIENLFLALSSDKSFLNVILGNQRLKNLN